ncbi:MAG: response regulator [Nitrospiraceae bacterium]|nr:MAG: response regulator [Nitrospiraceae bacterium]
MESVQNNAESSARQQRILVLESSSVTRQLITDVLHSAGYDVIAPVDVKEAMQRIKDVIPDLVLTDVNSSVIELLAQLRKNRNSRYIPVALLVDKPDESGRKNDRAFINQWIQKPFTPETLLEGIRKYI